MKYPQQKSAANTALVQVSNRTRTPWDTRSFSSIASAILPKGYELSIVLIGDARARALNRAYRDKTYAANVLSFPLTPRAGEIFLNLAKITREAHRYDLSPQGHAAFLLIHGCLHLKGYQHGSRMERAEQALIKQFNLR